jgi:hypothetical protein
VRLSQIREYQGLYLLTVSMSLTVRLSGKPYTVGVLGFYVRMQKALSYDPQGFSNFYKPVLKYFALGAVIKTD